MTFIKKISIVALILIVIGVIGSLLTYNTLSKPASVSEEQVIESEDISNLEFDINNEEVELISTTEENISVKISGTSSGEIEDRIAVESEGDTLSIESLERNQRFFDINVFGDDLEITVSLPEKEYQALDVDIDNGDFQADQINIEEIQAKANNGNIELDNMAASAVHVESDNGNVYLRNVEGEIAGKTNNGLISLTVQNLERPIALASDNGNIEIETDSEPENATFDISVDNGQAKVFGESDWKAVYGDGDNLIQLTTDNGNITVSK